MTMETVKPITKRSALMGASCRTWQSWRQLSGEKSVDYKITTTPNRASCNQHWVYYFHGKDKGFSAFWTHQININQPSLHIFSKTQRSGALNFDEYTTKFKNSFHPHVEAAQAFLGFKVRIPQPCATKSWAMPPSASGFVQFVQNESGTPPKKKRCFISQSSFSLLPITITTIALFGVYHGVPHFQTHPQTSKLG